MEQNQVLKPDEDGEVPCPICDEYHGKPESVEGHITGKSDEAHRGKIGKDYRLVQNGVRTLSTEQNPELKGTVPIFDEETESNDTEPENVTQPEDEDKDEDRDQGVVATLILALAIAVLWLARRTGNEDEVRKVELL